MDIISRDNKIIKYIKSLNIKKNRCDNSTYFIEGIKMAVESLKFYDLIEFVVVCDEILLKISGYQSFIEGVNSKNIKLYKVSKNVFDSISDTNTPQGVLVVMKQYKSNIKIKKEGIYIILDDVQDPGNVGTILRIADAIKCDGVFISQKSADIYSPKVLRSSMGAIFRVPTERVDSLSLKIKDLKENNIKLIGTSLKSNLYYSDCNYTKGIAVVVGNESQGISNEVLNIVDIQIKIPILGGAESLNVSVATGIVMYEIAKQVYGFDNNNFVI